MQQEERVCSERRWSGRGLEVGQALSMILNDVDSSWADPTTVDPVLGNVEAFYRIIHIKTRKDSQHMGLKEAGPSGEDRLEIKTN